MIESRAKVQVQGETQEGTEIDEDSGTVGEFLGFSGEESSSKYWLVPCRFFYPRRDYRRILNFCMGSQEIKIGEFQ